MVAYLKRIEHLTYGVGVSVERAADPGARVVRIDGRRKVADVIDPSLGHLPVAALHNPRATLPFEIPPQGGGAGYSSFFIGRGSPAESRCLSGRSVITVRSRVSASWYFAT